MANVWFNGGTVLSGFLAEQIRIYGGRSVGSSRHSAAPPAPPYYRVWSTTDSISYGGHDLAIIEPLRYGAYGVRRALARYTTPGGVITYQRFVPNLGLAIGVFNLVVSSSSVSSLTLTDTALGAGSLGFVGSDYIASYAAEWSDVSVLRGLSLPTEPVVSVVVTAGVITAVNVVSRGEYKTNMFEFTPAPSRLVLIGQCATAANLGLRWRPKAVTSRHTASIPIDDSRYTSGLSLTQAVGNGTLQATWAAGGAFSGVTLLTVGTGVSTTPCLSCTASTGFEDASDWEYTWELDSVVVFSGGTGYSDPTPVWAYDHAGIALASSALIADRAAIRLLSTLAPDSGTIHRQMMRIGYQTWSAVPCGVAIERHTVGPVTGLRSRRGSSPINWEWRPASYRIRDRAGTVIATVADGVLVRVVSDGLDAVIPVASMVGLDGGIEVIAPTPRLGGTLATFTSRHNVSSIVLTAAGSGYTAEPTVTITGGGGSGCTARAVLSPSGTISSIVVTDPGNGYTSCPTVTITGGGGAGATARVRLQCIGIDVTASGSGYGYRVTGSGWTADLIVDTTPGSDTRGQVVGATIAGTIPDALILSAEAISPSLGVSVSAGRDLIPVRSGISTATVTVDAGTWRAESGSDTWVTGELDVGELGLPGHAVDWVGWEIGPAGV